MELTWGKDQKTWAECPTALYTLDFSTFGNLECIGHIWLESASNADISHWPHSGKFYFYSNFGNVWSAEMSTEPLEAANYSVLTSTKYQRLTK